MDGSSGDGGMGFSPARLPPASFAAVARLLRASLDQAASDREFLQARNCLVTAGLYCVDASEYASWLRERENGVASTTATDTAAVVANSGSNGSPAVPADSELLSAAAGVLDEAAVAVGEEGSTGEGLVEGERKGAGGDYMLLRELRRHRVWTTIELWEVSISDSVVMAMDGGGERAERWLAGETREALREVRASRKHVLEGFMYTDAYTNIPRIRSFARG